MKVVIGKKLGLVTKPRVQGWKRNPSSDNEACFAAAHYAKKNGENMVVVPGSSYGTFVLHIARESDELGKYNPGAVAAGKPIDCYLVKPNGEVFEATVTK